MRHDRNSSAPPLHPATPCPDPEELASYVDRVLTDSQSAVVETHLVECEDCRAIVADAAVFVAAEEGSGPRPIVARTRGWRAHVDRKTMGALALAAGVVFAVWAGTIGRGSLWPFSDPVESAMLISAVEKEPLRLVTGRLSGIDGYAPPVGRLRGQGSIVLAPDRLSPDTRIAVANVERAAPGLGERAEALLGVAWLIGGQTDRAIQLLQRACERDAQEASCWNDLSVAYLVRAEAAAQQDDFVRALQAAERARELNSRMSEALFNRALALEGLSRTQDAIAAWKDVQEFDSSSPWATEAQTHIRNLSNP